MVINLIIPEIDSKPNNTKDAVISILVNEWPLSLREVYTGIKRKYGYKYSYQAVFKSIKELISEDILVAKDKKYELNIDWIKRLQSFTDIVETNYYAKERIHNISGITNAKNKEDVVILNFETIFDAEKYLYYFMKYILVKTENDSICHLGNHEWRPIFYLRAEYNYYKKLQQKNHKFYFVCSGNSIIERDCASFYKKIGVNFKINPDKIVNDILVFSDYFINIFIPEDLQIKMNRFLEKGDSISLLKEVLEKKSSIRVIITKDKNLAQEIKNQTLRKFRR